MPKLVLDKDDAYMVRSGFYSQGRGGRGRGRGRGGFRGSRGGYSSHNASLDTNRDQQEYKVRNDQYRQERNEVTHVRYEDGREERTTSRSNQEYRSSPQGNSYQSNERRNYSQSYYRPSAQNAGGGYANYNQGPPSNQGQPYQYQQSQTQGYIQPYQTQGYNAQYQNQGYTPEQGFQAQGYNAYQQPQQPQQYGFQPHASAMPPPVSGTPDVYALLSQLPGGAQYSQQQQQQQQAPPSRQGNLGWNQNVRRGGYPH